MVPDGSGNDRPGVPDANDTPCKINTHQNTLLNRDGINIRGGPCFSSAISDIEEPVEDTEYPLSFSKAKIALRRFSNFEKLVSFACRKKQMRGAKRERGTVVFTQYHAVSYHEPKLASRDPFQASQNVVNTV